MCVLWCWVGDPDTGFILHCHPFRGPKVQPNLDSEEFEKYFQWLKTSFFQRNQTSNLSSPMWALSQFFKDHADLWSRAGLSEPAAWILHGPKRDVIPLEVPVWNRVGEGRTNGKSTDLEKIWSSELEENSPWILQNEFYFSEELKLTSFVEKMMPVPLRLSFGRLLSRIDCLFEDLSSKSGSSPSSQAKKDCFGFSDLHLRFC